jgi:prevent-host-death family protein
MPVKINIHEAKTHFSRLLTRVCEGEEVIIAKAGKPVARLVPIGKRPKQRTSGSAKNKVVIGKDFGKPLPASVLKAFEK